MPRPKGTPKTGGRKAGTPNKDNPLKALLAAHSMDYFQPSIPAESLDFLRDKDGQTLPEYQGKGVGRKIIETLESDNYFLRAKRIEIPASITACPFYRKLGYTYKNGIDVVDEEQLFRLEKFR